MRSAILLMLLLGATARGDTLSAPCKGCTLVAPKSGERLPLLVVLHGDRESAAVAGARWRDAVRAGWAVLSLQCPRDQKCKDSWWQWNGDPQWIRDRIDVTTKQLPIDPTRIYAAGWSGGATYLGMHAPMLGRTFAAIVIHGGGMAPREDACGARPVPAYFLVGDKNPLHRLAVELHDYIVACGADQVWDLVSKADHDGERRALTRKKVGVILDWLSEHVIGVAVPYVDVDVDVGSGPSHVP